MKRRKEPESIRGVSETVGREKISHKGNKKSTAGQKSNDIGEREQSRLHHPIHRCSEFGSRSSGGEWAEKPPLEAVARGTAQGRRRSNGPDLFAIAGKPD